jgi:hypothetical protein
LALSQPEGHEKKMAFILSSQRIYVETAESMEELNKTRDEQDKLGAWAKNMLRHHGQVPEDPEKVQENEGGGGAVEEEAGDCSEAPG